MNEKLKRKTSKKRKDKNIQKETIKMKIKCLANPAHDQFMVTVQVAQDWKVDENGSFLECLNNLEHQGNPIPNLG